MAICAAGPPNAIVPSLRKHERKLSQANLVPLATVLGRPASWRNRRRHLERDDLPTGGRFSIAQVNISLVEPVLARRIEDIKVHGILHRLSLMWHVGRNTQDLTGAHKDLFAVDPELQRAFQNVSELFVDVAMFGNNTSLFSKEHAPA